LPHHQHRLVASLSTNSLQYVAIGNFGWPTQNKKVSWYIEMKSTNHGRWYESASAAHFFVLCALPVS
jgi:hypothetical protein